MPSPNKSATPSERRSRTREEIEAIRARHRIEQVIAAYTELRPAARRLLARCPLPGHRDSNPSFSVYPDAQRFYCYGCNRGGDVFTFIQLVEQVSFREAVARLDANEATSPIHSTPSSPPPVPINAVPHPSLNQAALSLLTAAAEVCHTALLLNAEMLAYVQGRGITMDSIKRFRLGYATDDNLAKYLRFRGWDLELARELKLVGASGEFFRERIIIPEWRNGQAIYLTGRKTKAYQQIKYLGLAGVPKPLSGLEFAHGAREVLICEGAFDLLTLVQWDYPAVALLGTHLKAEWVAELAFAERILVVTDSDEPGRRAAQVLAKALGLRACILPPLPNAKDVNELAMRSDGRSVFAEMVAKTHRR